VKESERGQIIGARLAGASMTKTATLLRVSRTALSKVYVGVHESCEDISGMEQWAKLSIDRKRPSYIEKDCFEKSRNYYSTGDRTAELNIHLEDPVFTKTVQRELHKSHIHFKAAAAKPLITESNAQIRERWCHDHKIWISDNQTTENA
jgi:hypothetical protein